MPSLVKKKVIVRVLGGIGNQLFSYAAARRLALHNEMELVIDDVSGFKYDHQFKRTNQLKNFSIPCRKATPGERMEPFSRLRRFLRKKHNRAKGFSKRDYILQEVFDFDNRLLDLNPVSDVYIEGYWQSENYFIDIEDIIRKDLEIIPPNDIINRKMADLISKKNSVAIHFRYFDIADSGPDNLPLDYYNKAIKRIREEVISPHFFIFSDKPELAAENLTFSEGEYTLVQHNQGDEMAYADLWLMKQCRHFIIANSTFSWWGAWLSENKDKVIIAPKLDKKFGESWWGFDGLLPSTWILLD